MSKKKKESFFWTSYSDLMTNLFFVMMMLFILAIALLHREVIKIGRERDATTEQLNKIKELEKSIENINAQYFEYVDEYKRHTLKNVNVSFRTSSSDINDISYEDREKLLNAGRAIQEFLKNAKRAQIKRYLIGNRGVKQWVALVTNIWNCVKSESKKKRKKSQGKK